MRSRTLLFSALALAAVAVGPTESQAQILASELAAMEQTIDGTHFRMEYYRPRARGRSPLFGHDSVVWEHIWTPGANWATYLEFQKPIQFNGVDLEPGKYGVWMVMADEDFMPHELVLEPYVRRFHTEPPTLGGADQIRMPIEVTEADHYEEMLTWDFETFTATGGTLALHWGNTRIAFDVKVESSMPLTVTEEQAALLLGDWDVVMHGPNGERVPGVSATFVLTEEDYLHASISGVPEMVPAAEYFNNMTHQWLAAAEGVFAWGEYYNGGMQNVNVGVFLEVEIEHGEGVAFEVRDDTDALLMSGIRKN